MNIQETKLKDFRNFLYYVWHSLPQIKRDPTSIQYDIAEYMQYGAKRGVIQGFRGVGKSWICSAFVVHQLLLDPSKNILVVSASKTRADDFSTFTLRLLQELEILKALKPRTDQRFSKVSFDVGLAPASHAPSVKSLGITSQLTGSRADIIIADDIEVPTNSATQGMRDKLSEQIKEFDAILKPNDDAKILFLGTPQCEDSVYRKLTERGYNCKVWPSETVTPETNDNVYGGTVSDLCVSDSVIPLPTEPSRFTELDLNERKISYGSVGYALQFMLNPSLSDIDRFPLKLRNLIIHDVDRDLAPEKLVWAASADLEQQSLPCVGLRGDRFYRPMKIVGDMVPYTGSVMSIDPSGRGKDETGYAVTKMLNGTLYVPEAGGLQGGYDSKTLMELVDIAKRNKVNKIVVESNFGDGMFTQLITPLLKEHYPCSIEEVRHNIQKEKRIIDTLEPLLGGHRLVIAPSVIEKDYKSAQVHPPEQQLHYMLFHQMTRITSGRGSIRHDDRLDALSIACNYWVEQMAQDADDKISERKEELVRIELDNFKNSYYKSKNKSSHLSWM